MWLSWVNFVLHNKDHIQPLLFLGINKQEDAQSSTTGDLIGLRIYNLTIEKIIDIILNHGPKGSISIYIHCKLTFNCRLLG